MVQKVAVWALPVLFAITLHEVAHGWAARALGDHLGGGVALFYAIALGCWGTAFWFVRPDVLALAALLPAAVHLGWQVATLDRRDFGVVRPRHIDAFQLLP